MAPLNYAQKILLWFMIWSSVLVSMVWIFISRASPFTTSASLAISIFWVFLIIMQVLLALRLGQRITRKMLFESRLRKRLKILKNNFALYEWERRQIQDHLFEAIIIVDEQNRICSLNRAAKKMLSPSKDLENLSLAEAIREPEIHELIAEAREHNQELIKTIQLGAGNAVRLWSKATPMNDKNLMLSILDITQFNALGERHDDFIAHASHELKTPIAVILANAELLMDTPVDAQASSLLLQAIHRQAERARKLLESLLELLRLNAGHYEVRPELIDLAKFVFELKESLGNVGSMIKNEIIPGTMVETDRTLLERLAHIVVENAQKYAGANPSLSVTAVVQKDHVKILFIDNGPGIKSHHRERVFDKFFREPLHATDDKEGFGLGLSHARAIASSLGGRIFVEDGPGCKIALMLDAWPNDSTRSNPQAATNTEIR